MDIIPGEAYVAVLGIAITPPWEFHPGKWSNLVQGFSPLRHPQLNEESREVDATNNNL